MENTRKPNYLVGFYFSILLILLLLVSTTPLLIRHGLSLSDHFVIEEEVLETAMILSLFGLSILILVRITKRLDAYRQQVKTVVNEKSRLTSRLVDAFRYIGKVNVEIQEIELALCGVACYPQSKKEFKRLVDQLASRALTIAAAPWLLVRMVDRRSGHTVNEHAVRHPGGTLPSITIGNRALLAGEPCDGLQTIGPRQKNLDLVTVFILPAVELEKEKSVLLTAILNQIEMLFILYRAGCIKPMHGSTTTTKGDQP